MESKIGTKGFAIHDDNIIPFSIDFIGEETYMMKTDKGFLEVNKDCFDIDDDNLKSKLSDNRMVVLCLEGLPGAKQVAYEVKATVTSNLLTCLNLRSRYNADLRYFVILNKNLTNDVLREMEKSTDKLIEESILCSI